MHPTDSVYGTLKSWQAGDIGWRKACAALGVEIEELHALAHQHGLAQPIALRADAIARLDAFINHATPNKP